MLLKAGELKRSGAEKKDLKKSKIDLTNRKMVLN